MAYDVDRTNGTALTTVLDGTVNDAKTDIKLFGRGIVNYGEIMAENQVQMLENFANDTAPLKPLLGQLYFDTTDNSLNVLIDEDPITFNKLITTATATASSVIEEESLVKGWAIFNVGGDILDPGIGDFGIASVDDLGVGEWRINWSTPFITTSYVVHASYVSTGTKALIPQFKNQLVDSVELNFRDVIDALDETNVSAIMVSVHGRV